MRYFLELSYNGKNYAGWQRQNNAISVQEVLEDNLSKILNNKIEIVGCGRTDAGVHAKQYFAHVDIEKALPENFLYRINNMLPEDIAIQKNFDVKPDFHARFDAVQRTYRYFIHFEKNPFLEEHSFLLLNKMLDIGAMNHCLRVILGEHDFSCFEKKGSDNKTSVCVLKDAFFEQNENGLVFTITANRFLRNMVRRITAAMLMLGLNQLSAEEIILAVLEKKELQVKMAVPAKGLFLWKIEYDFS
ncbi:MAG: tRNA pseudouridine(38-40) synthase TruA [Chitinophagales bacterium]|nr:tRNA pseudouridine(38-40) synthase TruA [Chitinophagales bacterium]